MKNTSNQVNDGIYLSHVFTRTALGFLVGLPVSLLLFIVTKIAPFKGYELSGLMLLYLGLGIPISWSLTGSVNILLDRKSTSSYIVTILGLLIALSSGNIHPYFYYALFAFYGITIGLSRALVIRRAYVLLILAGLIGQVVGILIFALTGAYLFVFVPMLVVTVFSVFLGASVWFFISLAEEIYWMRYKAKHKKINNQDNSNPIQSSDASV